MLVYFKRKYIEYEYQKNKLVCISSFLFVIALKEASSFTVLYAEVQ